MCILNSNEISGHKMSECIVCNFHTKNINAICGRFVSFLSNIDCQYVSGSYGLCAVAVFSLSVHLQHSTSEHRNDSQIHFSVDIG